MDHFLDPAGFDDALEELDAKIKAIDSMGIPDWTLQLPDLEDGDPTPDQSIPTKNTDDLSKADSGPEPPAESAESRAMLIEEFMKKNRIKILSYFDRHDLDGVTRCVEQFECVIVVVCVCRVAL